MGGGSGSGGTSTTSTKQGLPKWELPYAKGLTGIATQLFGGGGPYPQQQTAPFSPDQLAAMQGIEQLTPQQQAYIQSAQQANQQFATGQNPYLNQALQGAAGLAGGTQALQGATGALSGIATGQDPYMQQVEQANLGRLNDPSMRQAIAANQATISGQYLNPATNPALQSYLQAGMDPIVQNFQQSVAPSLLGAAVTSGGLGSGGSQAAMQGAEQTLGRELGNYSAQVIEPAYQAERQLQQQAIQGAAGLLSPEQQAIAQQQGLTGTQISAAGAIPGMYQPQLSAMGQIPSLLYPQQAAIAGTPGLVSGAYTPSGQLLQAGQLQQQQLQDVFNTIFANQMMPYQMEQMGAGLIGPLSGGGQQGFQVSTAPGGSMK